MRYRNFALVTILEILEHDAAAFCAMSAQIGKMMLMFDTRLIGEQDAILALDLPSVKMQLDRMNADFKKNTRLEVTVLPSVRELYNRLTDELSHRVFLAVPASSSEIYKQTAPLFGEDVEAKFPFAAEDISEAGKCMALGRYTAAIFHLMRALEICVRDLGGKLNANVKDVDGNFRPWKSMTDNIKIEIDKMPKSDASTNWYRVQTSLESLARAWRNPTMHPKQTYTEEEAREVFQASRSFMRHVAPLV
jgi:HEPN domain-containing protein